MSPAPPVGPAVCSPDAVEEETSFEFAEIPDVAATAPALTLRKSRRVVFIFTPLIPPIFPEIRSGGWLHSARWVHQRGKKLRGYTVLNRCLLIFRALIFESRVDCGIPSLAAAPRGPDTLPLHSASAASIISFSWVASFSERG